jgi:class 3 adenylate cyclase
LTLFQYRCSSSFLFSLVHFQETIYHAFDKVAKQRRVFKVETVGDCYVAATGLPDPCEDHALVMAKFARQCLVSMSFLTKKLEVELGPDTSDLGMRVGIHSGPITAGVLRGERARFQLFGDTMNTASRMESTGKRSKIHCSQETADQLIKFGKSHWIKAREDRILVKGKGQMQTYWVQIKSDPSAFQKSSGSLNFNLERSHSECGSSFGNDSDIAESHVELVENKLSKKVLRLVDWNVDNLVRLLKEIVSRRNAACTIPDAYEKIEALEADFLGRTENTLSEVQEIITLPAFHPYPGKLQEYNSIEFEDVVLRQLHTYIEAIARMYNDNPFHNFEHASHVTLSVVKLFSRIIAPDLEHEKSDARSLHTQSFGITSDPLTQFAVIISALVHDADHPGVPNSQLVKEEAPLATVYDNKSVAEQNSLDLVWQLLMQDQFKELRRTLYTTETAFRRFRQLMVNAVLATDIMDKDMKTLRNYRWDKAFSENAGEESDIMNQKATIVIEHLIQASDVAVSLWRKTGTELCWSLGLCSDSHFFQLSLFSSSKYKAHYATLAHLQGK